MRIALRPFHSSGGEWRVEDAGGETVLSLNPDHGYFAEEWSQRQVALMAGNATRMFAALKKCKRHLESMAKGRADEWLARDRILAVVNRALRDATESRPKEDES